VLLGEVASVVNRQSARTSAKGVINDEAGLFGRRREIPLG